MALESDFSLIEWLEQILFLSEKNIPELVWPYYGSYQESHESVCKLLINCSVKALYKYTPFVLMEFEFIWIDTSGVSKVVKNMD